MEGGPEPVDERAVVLVLPLAEEALRRVAAQADVDAEAERVRLEEVEEEVAQAPRPRGGPGGHRATGAATCGGEGGGRRRRRVAADARHGERERLRLAPPHELLGLARAEALRREERRVKRGETRRAQLRLEVLCSVQVLRDVGIDRRTREVVDRRADREDDAGLRRKLGSNAQCKGLRGANREYAGSNTSSRIKSAR